MPPPLIKYLGHKQEGIEIDEVIEWAGGKAVSDDQQRHLFVPVHTNPLLDRFATIDGNLNAESFKKVLSKSFSWGLSVMNSPFAGKFFASALVERLIANPDTLMLDQFGQPYVPSAVQGEGDTYFVVDSYPAGPQSEFLETIERIQRQMAQATAQLFTEHPEWKSQLVGSVMAGEMKYPHKDETDGKPRWFDYSHYALEAYQWYTSQYVGAGKRWGTFAAFKKEMGMPATKMTGGIGSLVPPKSTAASAPEWNRLPSEENQTQSRHFRWWHSYRLWNLKRHITENVRWWREEGVEQVYWGSQVVLQTADWRRYWSAMEPRMLDIPGVVPGLSLYHRACSNRTLLAQVQKATEGFPGQGWNSFQWNPADTVQGVAQNLEVLRLQYEYGAQVINIHPAYEIDPAMISDGDCAVKRWMADG